MFFFAAAWFLNSSKKSNNIVVIYRTKKLKPKTLKAESNKAMKNEEIWSHKVEFIKSFTEIWPRKSLFLPIYNWPAIKIFAQFNMMCEFICEIQ